MAPVDIVEFIIRNFTLSIFHFTAVRPKEDKHSRIYYIYMVDLLSYGYDDILCHSYNGKPKYQEFINEIIRL